MGQVLNGSAATTEAVRRAIQPSQESLRALAKRYGINQKTVAKWRNPLRANDDETQTRREFTLEGRGHSIRWLCAF